MKKMKVHSLTFLLLVLLVPGCTSLSQKLQNILETKSSPTTSEQKKISSYCENRSTHQSLLEDPQFVKSSLFKNAPFSFIEKSVLLSLIEMERRPDTIGPYSRLQVITKINNEIQYYDFRPKVLDDDTKIAFLFGLDFLLKKYNANNSINTIANFADHTWPAHYLVSSELENFLQLHKIDIQKNADLSKIFMKGDETLTRFETFPHANLQKSLMLFNKKKLFDNNHYEFSKNNLSFKTTLNGNNTTQCNFDLGKDLFSPDDLFFETDYSSFPIVFSENDNFFFAIASSYLKKPIEMKDEFYLKTRPSLAPLPICVLNNPNLKLDIIISSTLGRNPSQHIKHLIAYDIINSNSVVTLGHTLNFARHLFLNNPDRILYESKKGRKEQLNFFLQMNFPIYHVDQLGDITALASYERNKYHSIIKDERNTKQLLCTP